MTGILLGQLFSAMAALAGEIILTRLFSLSQWYHFAFLAISVALLGYGVSGTLLALSARRPPLSALALAQALAMVGGYLAANNIPFDSYRIAWEPIQLLYMAIYFLSLTVPFIFAGLITASLFEHPTLSAGRVYAANLGGSGLGCAASLALQPLFEGVGSIIAVAGLAGLGATAFALAERRPRRAAPALGLTLLLGYLALNPPAGWEIRLSPYKPLVQALQHPNAALIYQRWNAYSRLDVVQAEGLRAVPGLSLAYTRAPAGQLGLFTDGDNMSPIQTDADMQFLDYVPEAVLFALRPDADVLLVEPAAGQSVWAARRAGASSIVALISNPLVLDAVARSAPAGLNPYQGAGVEVHFGGARSALARAGAHFDIVHFPLSDAFHPIRSGAFSLSENYLLTVEGVQDALRALAPEGILAISRWLQLPPTESVRAGALVVEALEQEGIRNPADHLIVLRSWSTCLILAGRRPFSAEEIALVRAFAEERQFDLVAGPGISPSEANRFNQLEEPVYFQAFQALLHASDRGAFYRRQDFDISPPTDDRPFFFHFFTWEQAPEVWQSLGMTWQPFGGSGYFVLLALLAFTLLAGVGLILLPLLFRRKGMPRHGRAAALSAFALLGLAYMLVEMPLLQQCILLLDQPTYSFAVVLFALLLFSGLGSLFAERIPPNVGLLGAGLCALALAGAVSPLVHLFLAAPLWLRGVAALLALAPVGFAMGIPMPRLIASLRAGERALIPWAWAVNGVASVTSSVLATMIALSWGFRITLLAGALAYLGAYIAGRRLILVAEEQARR